MIILDLVQGSPEWHAHRAKTRNASEAPAMLGFSKYKKRSELLREKFTGLVPEVDESTQWLFDKGHKAEALARPNIEAKTGRDLYPVTATSDDGYLSASYDGLTMEEDWFWENKLFNKDVFAYVNEHKDLPDTHWPQVEQQCIIANTTEGLFTLCDENGVVKLEFQYKSVESRRAAVMAGWKQFDEDLANYKLGDVVTETVAAPVLSLPSVSVQVKGAVAIIDNFDLFEVALRDFIDNKLIRKPQNDQDFADLDSQIKALKKAEEALAAAEMAVISQVESIEKMRRTKDLLHKMARDNRLMAEKLLEAEKTNRRNAIVDGGKTAYATHIANLNKRLGKPYMVVPHADFAGVVKSKRSISSIQEAVDGELVRVKIASNEICDLIDANLKTLREMAADYPFLFMDAQTICMKQSDDLVNLIKLRISDHQKAEAAKVEAEVQRRLKEEQDAADKKRLAEQARVENCHSLIRHIVCVGNGMIGDKVQPLGLLERELEEKITLPEWLGEFMDEAKSALATARSRLREARELQHVMHPEANDFAKTVLENPAAITGGERIPSRLEIEESDRLSASLRLKDAVQPSGARVIKVEIDGKPATHEQVALVAGLMRPTSRGLVDMIANSYGVGRKEACQWIIDAGTEIAGINRKGGVEPWLAA